MKNKLPDKSGSDRVLLGLIKDGDSRAFEILFEKYYKTLCRFAFLFTRDADLSQSLVQDVFLKLWERRFKNSAIENLAGYLTTMVRNRCSDYQKQQKHFDLTTEMEDNQTDYSTEESIYGHNFEESLLAALSNLPAKCRLAFEYSRFENLTNKEIAEKLNISVKGVEALIGRSLKLLRADLKEFLPSSKLNNINPILFFLNIRCYLMPKLS